MDSSASFSGELAVRIRRSLHFSVSGFRYIHGLRMRRQLSISYGIGNATLDHSLCGNKYLYP